jgi:hypothetical protein
MPFRLAMVGKGMGGGWQEGGLRMRKKRLLLLSLAMLLFSPSLVLSDCMDIGRYTSYYVQGAHTIIFYTDSGPIAYFDIPYCSINPSSMVRPFKTYVCDGDKIFIDNEACTIMSVYSSSTRSF